MTIQLSPHTYELLTRRARQVNRSPDELADQVLHRELQPAHLYIETEKSSWGARAVVKDTGAPVSVIVGYARLGLAPEQFAEEPAALDKSIARQMSWLIKCFTASSSRRTLLLRPKNPGGGRGQ